MEQCRGPLCQQRPCGNGFLLGYHCRTIGLALVILGRYSRNGRSHLRAAQPVAQHGANRRGFAPWWALVSSLRWAVGGESEAVSDVTVTDGVQVARAISFSTVAQGKITLLVEFWPEPYAAPTNRTHLVEAML